MQNARQLVNQIPEPNATLSVLIAEDNEVTVALLSLLLISRGHKVEVVYDGEAALLALHLVISMLH